jgi:cell division protein FtsZ
MAEQAPAAQYEDEEPSLFQQAPAPQPAPVQAQQRPLFEEMPQATAQVQDDLPPPAYRPAVSEFQPQPDSIEADPQDFVAPRPAAPGTPSPDTLARLKAAAARSRDDAPAAASAQAAPPPAPEPEKPRFSVNSLIGRMTGQSSGHDAAQAPSRRQPPLQSQRPMAVEEPEVHAEDERIEIPAFLRRQAN